MAADTKVEALLAKMRQAYSSIQSARLETTTYEHEFNAHGIAESGLMVYDMSVLYKRPNLIRAVVNGGTFPTTRIILAKGASIETTMGKLRLRSFPFTFDAMSRVLPANLETLCFWDWDVQLSTEQGKNMHASTFRLIENVPWNGKRWTVLEESAVNVDRLCIYYIDPKTNLMWRTFIRALGSRREIQDARIVRMVLNPPVADTDFVQHKR